MMTYPKIWLLRHGQTEWNAQERIQGQLESPLTALGIEQAHQQAALLGDILALNPDCFCSPLGRAQQTAKIALGGNHYETDARLAEVYAGVWQGLTRDEVRAQWPELFHANPHHLDLFCAATESEGFQVFQSRIADFLGDLTGPSVLVAHGLLGQVVRGLTRGLKRPKMGALTNQQGCVYLLENGTEQVLE
ncbi:MAG: histidine phosphatase family protein [Rhodobacteraceae bacterium]|nr:histidine phosphatase family protein [Paracoccaceae bacterium]